MSATVLVADCSVTGAWFLPDEVTAPATELLERILAGDVELVEPALWYYESANLLRSAVRRRRLTTAAAREAGELLQDIPVTLYTLQPAECAELLGLSLDTGLTAYDATYLQLAGRLRCPLLTADTALLGANTPGARVTRLSDWLG
jgi:predicted nucleic acid-binding protein